MTGELPRLRDGELGTPETQAAFNALASLVEEHDTFISQPPDPPAVPQGLVKAATGELSVNDINAANGAVIIEAQLGVAFNLLDAKLQAISGDASGATSVQVGQWSGLYFASAAIATLTQGTVVTMADMANPHTIGLPCDPGVAVAISKLGEDPLAGCTHIRYVVLYVEVPEAQA